MRNFERKTAWKNIIESKPVLIFLSILILVFAWSVFRFWNKMEETGKNRKVIEDKITELREKREKLLLDIDNLNTEEGKEEFFRENYGLIKEGEEMIIVVEEKKSAEEPELKPFSRFFLFFKNWFN
jgi:cell division protein FtsB